MFVAEPKETTEQVRVIGLTDDKVVDGSDVPVSHIIPAQWSTAVPQFFQVDLVHLAFEAFSAARSSV